MAFLGFGPLGPAGWALIAASAGGTAVLSQALAARADIYQS
jgi:hypothetical protein